MLKWFTLIVCLIALPVSGEEPLQAPACLRIVTSTDAEATIRFEPKGGESFEAERYYNGKWSKYKASIITSGEQHSVLVPLSKNLMNIVRVCAIRGSERACPSEGVYAKR